MKVLVVSHACVVDANQTLYRWIEQLPAIELQIVAPRTWKTDLVGESALHVLPELRSPVRPLRPMFSGRGSLHFYTGAVACVSAFKPDLLFVDEEPWSVCALQFSRLAKRAGARFVFYTKENLPRRQPWPLRWIERQVFAGSSAAAVISPEASEVLRAKGYRGPVVTLPHGYEPDWFQRRDSADHRKALGLDGIVVGYVGRLAREKGVDDLIAAARLVRTRHPEIAFHLLIIGSGQDAMELKGLVARAGLEQSVTFLPAVAHNRIAPYYNCLDVLAVPSRTTPRWKEQFGRVLIEAMASGVCVAGSSSGEIPNVIGDAGLVFDEGNVPALADALLRLIIDPTLRNTLAARGRQRAETHYSNPVVAAQMTRIWNQALSSSQ